MTKTNLITAINTQLTAVITQAKVRLASLVVVDELYPTPIIDTEISDNVVEVIGSNFEYRLVFTKIGRNVNVNGYIKNVSGSILELEEIATIVNSEFMPLETFSFCLPNNNTNVDISVSDVISIVSSMPNDVTYLVNINYPVLN
jgi:hypothetical protein